MIYPSNILRFQYKYADLAKRDILGVTYQYKDLRPTHGPFSKYNLNVSEGSLFNKTRNNVYQNC